MWNLYLQDLYTLKQMPYPIFNIKVNHLPEFEAILPSVDFRDRIQTLKTLQETRDCSMPDIPLVTLKSSPWRVMNSRRVIKSQTSHADNYYPAICTFFKLLKFLGFVREIECHLNAILIYTTRPIFYHQPTEEETMWIMVVFGPVSVNRRRKSSVVQWPWAIKHSFTLCLFTVPQLSLHSQLHVSMRRVCTLPLPRDKKKNFGNLKLIAEKRTQHYAKYFILVKILS